MELNRDTISNLARLDGAMRKSGRVLYTLPLYVYLLDFDGCEIRMPDIKTVTGIDQRSIRFSFEVLQDVGLLQVDVGKHQVKTVHLRETPVDPISDISVLIHRPSLLGITSITSKNKKEESPLYKYNHVQNRKNTVDGFTLKDIKEDGDWKSALEQLDKHFPADSTDPAAFLTKTGKKKRYWSKLSALIEDDSFDFGKYCEWYHRYKYPRLAFSWGMFLLGSMLTEFRTVNTNDEYLKTTTNIESSTSFQSMAEKQAVELAAEFGEES